MKHLVINEGYATLVTDAKDLADSLNINIGTLNEKSIDAMIEAGKTATDSGDFEVNYHDYTGGNY